MLVFCRPEYRRVPEMLIVSFGLWHMLHVTTVKGFNAELHAFRTAADNFVSRQDVVSNVFKRWLESA